MRYEASPNTMIFVSAGTQQYEQFFLNKINRIRLRSTGEGNNLETQLAFNTRMVGLIAGGGRFEGTQGTSNASCNNVYVYARFSDPTGVAQLQVGAAPVHLNNLNVPRGCTCPKLGVVLTPANGSVIRFAAFETIQRQFLANQTIEPTQVAGFNQFWDDPIASIAWQHSLGIDQRIGRRLFTGFEIVERTIEVPLFIRGRAIDFPWQERTVRGYISRLIPRRTERALFPDWSFALTAEYWHEDLLRDARVPGSGIVELTSHLVPLSITAVPSARLTLKAQLTIISQKGTLQRSSTTARFPVDDEALVFDMAVNYALPRRQGSVSLGVSNLFDRRFSFVESDPALLRVAPERVVFARFSAKF